MQQRRSRLSRVGLLVGIAAAAALVAPGLIPLASADPSDDESPSRELAVTECMPPEGAPFEEGTTARFTDNNVNVYADEDLTLRNSAVEGLTVGGGDLQLDALASDERAGEDEERAEPDGPPYRLGSIPEGSGSVPEGNALMLAVAGDLQVAADLDEVLIERVTSDEAGPGGEAEPGKYMVGGWDESSAVISAGDFVDTFDLQGTHADNFGSALAAISRHLSNLEDTGTVAPSEGISGPADGLGPQSGRPEPLLFEGDGESDLQVFTVTAEDLEGRDTLRFEEIPDAAAVLLNYTESNANLPGSYRVSFNGSVLDPGTAEWSGFTQRVLWHFPSARTVEISAEQDDESSNWLGSVLAGRSGASVTVSDTSLNGRLYSRGSITVEGDAPVRSYPFRGVPKFDCKPHAVPEPGGFVVVNELQGVTDSQLPEDAEFRVEATITEPDSEPYTEELHLAADGTPVEGPQGLPAGSRIAFDQLRTPVVEGYAWESVTFEPASIVIEDEELTEVTVTNTYVEDPPELGGFELVGALQGIPEDRVEDGAVLQVTATWETSAGSNDEAEPVRHSEEFAVPVGEGAVQGPQDVPEGTEVFLTLSAAPTIDGFRWSGSSIDPRSVTIVAEEAQQALATASYTRTIPKYGGFSLQNVVEGVTPTDFPPGTSFIVRASWVEEDVGVFEEFALPVDGSVVAGPANLPVGTEVRFSVIQSPRAKGFAWQSVEFTPPTLTVTDGDNPTVQALSRYRAVDTPVGGFSLSAGVTGADPAEFPAGTTIPVTATWTADGNKISVAYELTVDGVPIQGPQDIPVGTDVTFSAPTSPNLPEHRSGGVTFSTRTLTISDGSDRMVTAMSSYRPDMASEDGLTVIVLVALAGVALSAGAVQLYRRNRPAGSPSDDQVLG